VGQAANIEHLRIKKLKEPEYPAQKSDGAAHRKEVVPTHDRATPSILF